MGRIRQRLKKYVRNAPPLTSRYHGAALHVCVHVRENDREHRARQRAFCALAKSADKKEFSASSARIVAPLDGAAAPQECS